MLAGTQSFFSVEEVSSEDKTRLEIGDLHICGWLPGKQASDAKGEAIGKEQDSLQYYSNWLTGLARLNLDSARRAFRCIPKDLKVEQQNDIATLSFSLGKGCFATSVIREMVDAVDVQMRAGS